MNGYTEMILMDKTEDDPLYADLKKILETGLKGADMVQRLLSFSKQTATKLEPVDLNHRIDETKKLMDRSFPKTIEIETNLPDDLGMVNADAGQMDQLLMNLCVNAKDAMPDGGRLRIQTRNITVDEDYCRFHVGAKPGRYVVIAVADTGTGMNRETMDRAFDPFFTTKGWDFRKGTGLGLSVAKGIVEQHGGWITCESELGKGTIFRAYFPAVEERPIVKKGVPAEVTVPGSEMILLVDDEEYVRDLGKRILERAGYKVITASNGKEALEIYGRAHAKIGLVVLDLVMPQVEGKQCLEELLKINRDVKVIVSSGHSLDARERLHLGSLARGFVNKPYEVRQMVQTVKRVLDVGGPME
jgi:two-component system, cell cycle sensor histidine kinase and response regulator CckA